MIFLIKNGTINLKMEHLISNKIALKRYVIFFGSFSTIMFYKLIINLKLAQLLFLPNRLNRE